MATLACELQGSSVSIVTRLRPALAGFDSGHGEGRDLFIYHRVQTGSTQPPVQWVPGALSSGREADHSPPSNAVVNNAWSYTSTSPCVFV
jgi:hypothetical protein